METMEAAPQPDPKEPGALDKIKLAALGSVLAAAITVAVSVSPDDPPTKLDESGIVIVDPGTDAGIEIDAGPPTAQFDTAKYTREIRTYRKQHPGTVDLLTGPVEPGAQVTTGANVDLGKRATDVQPVGGSWTIDATTFRDDTEHTWIEVTATNTGSEPARFVGIVKLQ